MPVTKPPAREGFVALSKDYSIYKYSKTKHKSSHRTTSEFDPYNITGVSSEDLSQSSSDNTIVEETTSYNSHVNYDTSYREVRDTYVHQVEETRRETRRASNHKRLSKDRSQKKGDSKRNRKRRTHNYREVKQEEEEVEKESVTLSYTRTYSYQSVNSAVFNSISNPEPYTRLHHNKKSIKQCLAQPITAKKEPIIKRRKDTSDEEESSSSSFPVVDEKPFIDEHRKSVPSEDATSALKDQLDSCKARFEAVSQKVKFQTPLVRSVKVEPDESDTSPKSPVCCHDNPLNHLSDKDFKANLNLFLTQLMSRIQERNISFDDILSEEYDESLQSSEKDEIDAMDEEELARSAFVKPVSALFNTINQNRDYNKDIGLEKRLLTQMPALNLRMPCPSSSGAGSVNTSYTTQDSSQVNENSSILKETTGVQRMNFPLSIHTQTESPKMSKSMQVGLSPNDSSDIGQTKSDVSVGFVSSDENNKNTHDKAIGTDDLSPGEANQSTYFSFLSANASVHSHSDEINTSFRSTGVNTNGEHEQRFVFGTDNSDSYEQIDGSKGVLEVSPKPSSYENVNLSDLSTPLSTFERDSKLEVEAIEVDGDTAESAPVADDSSSDAMKVDSPGRRVTWSERVQHIDPPSSNKNCQNEMPNLPNQFFDGPNGVQDTGQIRVNVNDIPIASTAEEPIIGHVSADVNPFPFMVVSQVDAPYTLSQPDLPTNSNETCGIRIRTFSDTDSEKHCDDPNKKHGSVNSTASNSINLNIPPGDAAGASSRTRNYSTSSSVSNHGGPTIINNLGGSKKSNFASSDKLNIPKGNNDRYRYKECNTRIDSPVSNVNDPMNKVLESNKDTFSTLTLKKNLNISVNESDYEDDTPVIPAKPEPSFGDHSDKKDSTDQDTGNVDGNNKNKINNNGSLKPPLKHRDSSSKNVGESSLASKFKFTNDDIFLKRKPSRRISTSEVYKRRVLEVDQRKRSKSCHEIISWPQDADKGDFHFRDTFEVKDDQNFYEGKVPKTRDKGAEIGDGFFKNSLSEEEGPTEDGNYSQIAHDSNGTIGLSRNFLKEQNDETENNEHKPSPDLRNLLPNENIKLEEERNVDNKKAGISAGALTKDHSLQCNDNDNIAELDDATQPVSPKQLEEDTDGNECSVSVSDVKKLLSVPDLRLSVVSKKKQPKKNKRKNKNSQVLKDNSNEWEEITENVFYRDGDDKFPSADKARSKDDSLETPESFMDNINEGIDSPPIPIGLSTTDSDIKSINFDPENKSEPVAVSNDEQYVKDGDSHSNEALYVDAKHVPVSADKDDIIIPADNNISLKAVTGNKNHDFGNEVHDDVRSSMVSEDENCTLESLPHITKMEVSMTEKVEAISKDNNDSSGHKFTFLANIPTDKDTSKDCTSLDENVPTVSHDNNPRTESVFGEDVSREKCDDDIPKDSNVSHEDISVDKDACAINATPHNIDPEHDFYDIIMPRENVILDENIPGEDFTRDNDCVNKGVSDKDKIENDVFDEDIHRDTNAIKETLKDANTFEDDNLDENMPDENSPCVSNLSNKDFVGDKNICSGDFLRDEDGDKDSVSREKDTYDKSFPLDETLSEVCSDEECHGSGHLPEETDLSREDAAEHESGSQDVLKDFSVAEHIAPNESSVFNDNVDGNVAGESISEADVSGKTDFSNEDTMNNISVNQEVVQPEPELLDGKILEATDNDRSDGTEAKKIIVGSDILDDIDDTKPVEGTNNSQTGDEVLFVVDDITKSEKNNESIISDLADDNNESLSSNLITKQVTDQDMIVSDVMGDVKDQANEDDDSSEDGGDFFSASKAKPRKKNKKGKKNNMIQDDAEELKVDVTENFNKSVKKSKKKKNKKNKRQFKQSPEPTRQLVSSEDDDDLMSPRKGEQGFSSGSCVTVVPAESIATLGTTPDPIPESNSTTLVTEPDAEITENIEDKSVEDSKAATSEVHVNSSNSSGSNQLAIVDEMQGGKKSRTPDLYNDSDSDHVVFQKNRFRASSCKHFLEKPPKVSIRRRSNSQTENSKSTSGNGESFMKTLKTLLAGTVKINLPSNNVSNVSAALVDSKSGSLDKNLDSSSNSSRPTSLNLSYPLKLLQRPFSVDVTSPSPADEFKTPVEKTPSANDIRSDNTYVNWLTTLSQFNPVEKGSDSNMLKLPTTTQKHRKTLSEGQKVDVTFLGLFEAAGKKTKRLAPEQDEAGSNVSSLSRSSQTGIPTIKGRTNSSSAEVSSILSLVETDHDSEGSKSSNKIDLSSSKTTTTTIAAPSKKTSNIENLFQELLPDNCDDITESQNNRLKDGFSPKHSPKRCRSPKRNASPKRKVPIKKQGSTKRQGSPKVSSTIEPAFDDDEFLERINQMRNRSYTDDTVPQYNHGDDGASAVNRFESSYNFHFSEDAEQTPSNNEKNPTDIDSYLDDELTKLKAEKKKLDSSSSSNDSPKGPFPNSSNKTRVQTRRDAATHKSPKICVISEDIELVNSKMDQSISEDGNGDPFKSRHSDGFNPVFEESKASDTSIKSNKSPLRVTDISSFISLDNKESSDQRTLPAADYENISELNIKPRCLVFSDIPDKRSDIEKVDTLSVITLDGEEPTLLGSPRTLGLSMSHHNLGSKLKNGALNRDKYIINRRRSISESFFDCDRSGKNDTLDILNSSDLDMIMTPKRNISVFKLADGREIKYDMDTGREIVVNDPNNMVKKESIDDIESSCSYAPVLDKIDSLKMELDGLAKYISESKDKSYLRKSNSLHDLSEGQWGNILKMDSLLDLANRLNKDRSEELEDLNIIPERISSLQDTPTSHSFKSIPMSTSRDQEEPQPKHKNIFLSMLDKYRRTKSVTNVESERIKDTNAIGSVSSNNPVKRTKHQSCDRFFEKTNTTAIPIISIIPPAESQENLENSKVLKLIQNEKNDKLTVKSASDRMASFKNWVQERKWHRSVSNINNNPNTFRYIPPRVRTYSEGKQPPGKIVVYREQPSKYLDLSSDKPEACYQEHFTLPRQKHFENWSDERHDTMPKGRSRVMSKSPDKNAFDNYHDTIPRRKARFLSETCNMPKPNPSQNRNLSQINLQDINSLPALPNEISFKRNRTKSSHSAISHISKWSKFSDIDSLPDVPDHPLEEHNSTVQRPKFLNLGPTDDELDDIYTSIAATDNPSSSKPSTNIETNTATPRVNMLTSTPRKPSNLKIFIPEKDIFTFSVSSSASTSKGVTSINSNSSYKSLNKNLSNNGASVATSASDIYVHRENITSSYGGSSETSEEHIHLRRKDITSEYGMDDELQKQEVMEETITNINMIDEIELRLKKLSGIVSEEDNEAQPSAPLEDKSYSDDNPQPSAPQMEEDFYSYGSGDVFQDPQEIIDHLKSKDSFSKQDLKTDIVTGEGPDSPITFAATESITSTDPKPYYKLSYVDEIPPYDSPLGDQHLRPRSISFTENNDGSLTTPSTIKDQDSSSFTASSPENLYVYRPLIDIDYGGISEEDLDVEYDGISPSSTKSHTVSEQFRRNFIILSNRKNEFQSDEFFLPLSKTPTINDSDLVSVDISEDCFEQLQHLMARSVSDSELASSSTTPQTVYSDAESYYSTFEEDDYASACSNIDTLYPSKSEPNVSARIKDNLFDRIRLLDSHTSISSNISSTGLYSDEESDVHLDETITDVLSSPRSTTTAPETDYDVLEFGHSGQILCTRKDSQNTITYVMKGTEGVVESSQAIIDEQNKPKSPQCTGICQNDDSSDGSYCLPEHDSDGTSSVFASSGGNILVFVESTPDIPSEFCNDLRVYDVFYSDEENDLIVYADIQEETLSKPNHNNLIVDNISVFSDSNPECNDEKIAKVRTRESSTDVDTYYTSGDDDITSILAEDCVTDDNVPDIAPAHITVQDFKDDVFFREISEKYADDPENAELSFDTVNGILIQSDAESTHSLELLSVEDTYSSQVSLPDVESCFIPTSNSLFDKKAKFLNNLMKSNIFTNDEMLAKVKEEEEPFVALTSLETGNTVPDCTYAISTENVQDNARSSTDVDTYYTSGDDDMTSILADDCVGSMDLISKTESNSPDSPTTSDKFNINDASSNIEGEDFHESNLINDVPNSVQDLDKDTDKEMSDLGMLSEVVRELQEDTLVIVSEVNKIEDANDNDVTTSNSNVIAVTDNVTMVTEVTDDVEEDEDFDDDDYDASKLSDVDVGFQEKSDPEFTHSVESLVVHDVDSSDNSIPDVEETLICVDRTEFDGKITLLITTQNEPCIADEHDPVTVAAKDVMPSITITTSESVQDNAKSSTDVDTYYTSGDDDMTSILADDCVGSMGLISKTESNFPETTKTSDNIDGTDTAYTIEDEDFHESNLINDVPNSVQGLDKDTDKEMSDLGMLSEVVRELQEDTLVIVSEVNKIEDANDNDVTTSNSNVIAVTDNVTMVTEVTDDVEEDEDFDDDDYDASKLSDVDVGFQEKSDPEFTHSVESLVVHDVDSSDNSIPDVEETLICVDRTEFDGKITLLITTQNEPCIADEHDPVTVAAKDVMPSITITTSESVQDNAKSSTDVDTYYTSGDDDMTSILADDCVGSMGLISKTESNFPETTKTSDNIDGTDTAYTIEDEDFHESNLINDVPNSVQGLDKDTDKEMSDLGMLSEVVRELQEDNLVIASEVNKIEDANDNDVVTSDSNVIVLTDNVTMVTEITNVVEENVDFDDDDCDASKLSDINVGFQEESDPEFTHSVESLVVHDVDSSDNSIPDVEEALLSVDRTEFDGKVTLLITTQNQHCTADQHEPVKIPAKDAMPSITITSSETEDICVDHSYGISSESVQENAKSSTDVDTYYTSGDDDMTSILADDCVGSMDLISKTESNSPDSTTTSDKFNINDASSNIEGEDFHVSNLINDVPNSVQDLDKDTDKEMSDLGMLSEVVRDLQEDTLVIVSEVNKIEDANDNDVTTSNSNVIAVTDNVTMVTEITDAFEEDVGFDEDDCDASKLSDVNVGFQEESDSDFTHSVESLVVHDVDSSDNSITDVEETLLSVDRTEFDGKVKLLITTQNGPSIADQHDPVTVAANDTVPSITVTTSENEDICGNSSYDISSENVKDNAGSCTDADTYYTSGDDDMTSILADDCVGSMDFISKTESNFPDSTKTSDNMDGTDTLCNIKDERFHASNLINDVPNSVQGLDKDTDKEMSNLGMLSEVVRELQEDALVIVSEVNKIEDANDNDVVTSDSNVIVLTDNVTMVTEITDAVEEDVGFDDDDCDASKLSDINVGFQEESDPEFTHSVESLVVHDVDSSDNSIPDVEEALLSIDRTEFDGKVTLITTQNQHCTADRHEPVKIPGKDAMPSITITSSENEDICVDYSYGISSESVQENTKSSTDVDTYYTSGDDDMTSILADDCVGSMDLISKTESNSPDSPTTSDKFNINDASSNIEGEDFHESNLINDVPTSVQDLDKDTDKEMSDLGMLSEVVRELQEDTLVIVSEINKIEDANDNDVTTSNSNMIAVTDNVTMVTEVTDDVEEDEDFDDDDYDASKLSDVNVGFQEKSDPEFTHSVESLVVHDVDSSDNSIPDVEETLICVDRTEFDGKITLLITTQNEPCIADEHDPVTVAAKDVMPSITITTSESVQDNAKSSTDVDTYYTSGDDDMTSILADDCVGSMGLISKTESNFPDSTKTSDNMDGTDTLCNIKDERFHASNLINDVSNSVQGLDKDTDKEMSNLGMLSEVVRELQEDALVIVSEVNKIEDANENDVTTSDSNVVVVTDNVTMVTEVTDAVEEDGGFDDDDYDVSKLSDVNVGFHEESNPEFTHSVESLVVHDVDSSDNSIPDVEEALLSVDRTEFDGKVRLLITTQNQHCTADQHDPVTVAANDTVPSIITTTSENEDICGNSSYDISSENVQDNARSSTDVDTHYTSGDDDMISILADDCVGSMEHIIETGEIVQTNSHENEKLCYNFMDVCDISTGKYEDNGHSAEPPITDNTTVTLDLANPSIDGTDEEQATSYISPAGGEVTTDILDNEIDFSVSNSDVIFEHTVSLNKDIMENSLIVADSVKVIDKSENTEDSCTSSIQQNFDCVSNEDNSLWEESDPESAHSLESLSVDDIQFSDNSLPNVDDVLVTASNATFLEKVKLLMHNKTENLNSNITESTDTTAETTEHLFNTPDGDTKSPNLGYTVDLNIPSVSLPSLKDSKLSYFRVDHYNSSDISAVISQAGTDPNDNKVVENLAHEGDPDNITAYNCTSKTTNKDASERLSNSNSVDDVTSLENVTELNVSCPTLELYSSYENIEDPSYNFSERDDYITVTEARSRCNNFKFSSNISNVDSLNECQSETHRPHDGVIENCDTNVIHTLGALSHDSVGSSYDDFTNIEDVFNDDKQERNDFDVLSASSGFRSPDRIATSATDIDTLYSSADEHESDNILYFDFEGLNPGLDKNIITNTTLCITRSLECVDLSDIDMANDVTNLDVFELVNSSEISDIPFLEEYFVKQQTKHCQSISNVEDKNVLPKTSEIAEHHSSENSPLHKRGKRFRRRRPAGLMIPDESSTSIDDLTDNVRFLPTRRRTGKAKNVGLEASSEAAPSSSSSSIVDIMGLNLSLEQSLASSLDEACFDDLIDPIYAELSCPSADFEKIRSTADSLPSDNFISILKSRIALSPRKKNPRNIKLHFQQVDDCTNSKQHNECSELSMSNLNDKKTLIQHQTLDAGAGFSSLDDNQTFFAHNIEDSCTIPSEISSYSKLKNPQCADIKLHPSEAHMRSEPHMLLEAHMRSDAEGGYHGNDDGTVCHIDIPDNSKNYPNLAHTVHRGDATTLYQGETCSEYQISTPAEFTSDNSAGCEKAAKHTKFSPEKDHDKTLTEIVGDTPTQYTGDTPTEFTSKILSESTVDPSIQYHDNVPADHTEFCHAKDHDETIIECTVDTPTEPVGDTPTEPIGYNTTEPVGDAPTEPVGDTPTEPVDDTRTEPIGDTPTEPIGDTPTEPVGDTPTEPIGGTPTEPIGGTPTEPVGDIPTEPIGGTPTKPIGDTPTEPIGDTPTEPVGDTPTEPIGVTPTEPVGDIPTEPVGDTPTEPVGDTPTEPVGDTPTEPIGGTPTKPIGGTPTKPVGDTSTEYDTSLDNASGECTFDEAHQNAASTFKDTETNFQKIAVRNEADIEGIYFRGKNKVKNTDKISLKVGALSTTIFNDDGDLSDVDDDFDSFERSLQRDAYSSVLRELLFVNKESLLKPVITPAEPQQSSVKDEIPTSSFTGYQDISFCESVEEMDEYHEALHQQYFNQVT